MVALVLAAWVASADPAIEDPPTPSDYDPAPDSCLGVVLRAGEPPPAGLIEGGRVACSGIAIPAVEIDYTDDLADYARYAHAWHIAQAGRWAAEREALEARPSAAHARMVGRLEALGAVALSGALIVGLAHALPRE